METEQQLLTAIRRGERAAQRRLYDRFSGYATAIGLRYIADRDEVMDVLQDSFVKILTSISQFNYHGEGSLKSWVARIVANCAIDHIKEHERFTFVDEIPDEPDEEGPDIVDLPPEVLTGMIAKLPPGYRLVLNLFVFEHLPHKEIGQRLGIKENSSASQFLRAKKMLARMIKDFQEKQGI